MCITNKKVPRRVEKLLQTMNSFKGNYDHSPRRSGFERRPERIGFVVYKVVGSTAVQIWTAV